MRVVWACAALGLMLGGCSTSGGSVPTAKPQLVGNVSSQPGNCFFRDSAGKVFIDTCPK